MNNSNTSGRKQGINKNSTDKKRRHRYAVNTKKIASIAILIAVAWGVMMGVITQFQPEGTDLSYNEFWDKLESGQIESVDIYSTGNTFTAHTKDGESLVVPNPKYDEFRKDLMETGVEVKTAQMSAFDAFQNLLLQLPIYLFMGVLIYYLISSMSSVARSYMKCATLQEGTTFDKVAGMSEVKDELKFTIDFLRNPLKYRDSGARVPKGLLMVGPPGTGKTLLAKAVAGEAGVPFIHTSGSDFCEMFAGLGAKRVRDLFEYARMNAPCVVFIDEIDSVGAKRNASSDAVSRDGNQTLNALLKEMDGIGSVSGVFVMAATNTPENLDKALVRPGRFDRQITVGPPKNRDDRMAIIDVHLNGKLVEEGVTPETISKKVVGFTGAEIEVVLNEAALQSLMGDREGVISMDDIDAAIEKLVTKGLRGKLIRNEELKRVAVHESGHALMMLISGNRVGKVTIIPSTSGVGGFTMPDLEQTEGRLLRTSDELYNEIATLYGGMCAEEIIYGQHSNGCSNDIKVASQKIAEYINDYCMYDSKVDVSAINKDLVADKMNKLGNEIYKYTLDKLSENKDKLSRLSDRLYTEETMSINDISEI